MQRFVRRFVPLALTVLVGGGLLGACNQDAEAFVDSLAITSVTPRNGDVGTVLQIEGSFSKGSVLAMCGNPLDDQGFKVAASDGSWTAPSDMLANTIYTLAQGAIPALEPGSTCSLRIEFKGKTIVEPDADTIDVNIDAQVPGVPANLAVSNGNGRATLRFSVPAANGSPILNYQYQLDEGEWVAFDPADTLPPVTVDGLTNGETYVLTLRAVNAIGAGEASEPVTLEPRVPSFPTPQPPGGDDGGDGGGSGDTGSLAVTPDTAPFFTASAIAAYGDASMALDDAGKLWSWGENAGGQLGQDRYGKDSSGGAYFYTAPTKTSFTGTFSRVFMGFDHAGGLDSNGALSLWGSNGQGQVEDPSGVVVTAPAAFDVSSLELSSNSVTDVGLGYQSTIVLMSNGTVLGAGSSAARLGLGSNVPVSGVMRTDATWNAQGVSIVDVETSEGVTLALDSAGRVWGWGDFVNDGQLGGASGNVYSAVQISATDWDAQGVSITDISVHFHALALDDAGDVWAWGSNTFGQLGLDQSVSSTSPVLTPSRVDDTNWASAGVSITSVETSRAGSFAIDDQGDLWAWGCLVVDSVCSPGFDYGSVPTKTDQPWSDGKLVASVTDVAAADYHVLVLDSQKRIWAWGLNQSGQVGEWKWGEGTSGSYLDPVVVNDGEGPQN